MILNHYSLNLKPSRKNEATNMTQQEYDRIHNDLDKLRETFQTIVNTDPDKARATLAQYLDLIASHHRKLKTLRK